MISTAAKRITVLLRCYSEGSEVRRGLHGALMCKGMVVLTPHHLEHDADTSFGLYGSCLGARKYAVTAGFVLQQTYMPSRGAGHVSEDRDHVSGCRQYVHMPSRVAGHVSEDRDHVSRCRQYVLPHVQRCASRKEDLVTIRQGFEPAAGTNSVMLLHVTRAPGAALRTHRLQHGSHQGVGAGEVRELTVCCRAAHARWQVARTESSLCTLGAGTQHARNTGPEQQVTKASGSTQKLLKLL